MDGCLPGAMPRCCWFSIVETVPQWNQVEWSIAHCDSRRSRVVIPQKLCNLMQPYAPIGRALSRPCLEEKRLTTFKTSERG